MFSLREAFAGHAVSVRVRIAAMTTIVVGIALAGAAIAVVRLQRDALIENVQDAITLRSDDIASLIESGQLPATLAQTDVEVAAVQVLDAHGEVISSTSNLAGARPMTTRRPATSTMEFERTQGLPIDDESFLLMARTVEARGQRYVLYVAGSLDPVEESVDALASTLWVATPGLVAFVGLGTWLVVGRALAPVESMRREVAGITANDRGRRVQEPKLADEIGRLARTMNAMLNRLEEAADRQERFVADAAHELRSPLASIRTQLEVAAAAGEAPMAGELLAEVVRLQRLADDLLLLARTGGAQPPDQEAVDLDDIVIAEARRLRVETGKHVNVHSVSAGQVGGSADQLRRVVRNLLENACRHASEAVALTLREEDGAVVLTVTDDGPGIPEAYADSIFERFTRVDSARSRDVGGTGLGLAIAQSIVLAHGGVIGLDLGHAGGARFVVRLPRPAGATTKS